MIYLDNNATTMMPRDVIAEMVEWSNRGNPSADYESATECRTIMDKFRAKLSAMTGYKTLIFTSGASESNAAAVRLVTDRAEVFAANTSTRPRVLASAVEHKSILDALQHEASRGKFELDIAPVGPGGHVIAADIARLTRTETVGVFVMHANNETGAVNDLATISQIVRRQSHAHIHVDAVQSFMKIPFDVPADSFSISFHKIHGPPGVGVFGLAVPYLNPLISGTQNGGLRGGTENVPGIAASARAVIYSAARVAGFSARNMFLAAVAKRFTVVPYHKYVPSTNLTIVVIDHGIYLPTTALIAVCAPGVCNKKIKHALAARSIIVSVGSACNTQSERASHVLEAMDPPNEVRRGALRISFDYTSTAEVVERQSAQFVDALVDICARKK